MNKRVAMKITRGKARLSWLMRSRTAAARYASRWIGKAFRCMTSHLLSHIDEEGCAKELEKAARRIGATVRFGPGRDVYVAVPPLFVGRVPVKLETKI